MGNIISIVFAYFYHREFGGGPFSNSRGVSLLAKVRFTMLPFCGVSSLTKLCLLNLNSFNEVENFYVLCLLNLNSLHSLHGEVKWEIIGVVRRV